MSSEKLSKNLATQPKEVRSSVLCLSIEGLFRWSFSKTCYKNVLENLFSLLLQAMKEGCFKRNSKLYNKVVHC